MKRAAAGGAKGRVWRPTPSCAPSSSSSPLSGQTLSSVSQGHGLCAVYKPAGPSSFAIVARVRDELKKSQQRAAGAVPLPQPKVGHGGTLDPFATGVLVLGVGKGCGLLQEYLVGPKEYVATGRLGVETDTLDTEGKEILQRPFQHITREMLESELLQFVGNIWQTPPAYSALRINGERAYKLARSGQQVDIPPRQVSVHSLSLVDFNPPFFTIRVRTEGGLYVRTLLKDIAHRLDSCAYATALERTQHGPFTADMALHEHEWTADAIHQAIAKWRATTITIPHSADHPPSSHM